MARERRRPGRARAGRAPTRGATARACSRRPALLRGDGPRGPDGRHRALAPVWAWAPSTATSRPRRPSTRRSPPITSGGSPPRAREALERERSVGGIQRFHAPLGRAAGLRSRAGRGDGRAAGGDARCGTRTGEDLHAAVAELVARAQAAGKLCAGRGPRRRADADVRHRPCHARRPAARHELGALPRDRARRSAGGGTLRAAASAGGGVCLTPIPRASAGGTRWSPRACGWRRGISTWRSRRG